MSSTHRDSTTKARRNLTVRTLIENPVAFGKRFYLSQRYLMRGGFTNHFTWESSGWSIKTPLHQSGEDPNRVDQEVIGEISHGRAELFLTLLCTVPLRPLETYERMHYDIDKSFIRIGLNGGRGIDDDQFCALVGQSDQSISRYWIAESICRRPQAGIDTDLVGPALRLVWEHTSGNDALRRARERATGRDASRLENCVLRFTSDHDVVEIDTIDSERWHAVIGDNDYCVVHRESTPDWMWADSLAPGVLPMLSAATARLLPPDEAAPIAAEALALDNFDSVVGSSMEAALMESLRMDSPKD